MAIPRPPSVNNTWSRTRAASRVETPRIEKREGRAFFLASQLAEFLRDSPLPPPRLPFRPLSDCDRSRDADQKFPGRGDRGSTARALGSQGGGERATPGEIAAHCFMNDGATSRRGRLAGMAYSERVPSRFIRSARSPLSARARMIKSPVYISPPPARETKASTRATRSVICMLRDLPVRSELLSIHPFTLATPCPRCAPML
jgi:hypothetical protein